MRAEFEAAGARLTVVASTDVGAPEFMEEVWKGGELFIEEAETIKQALGGGAVKNYWLLRPSVLRHLASNVGRFGSGTSDVLHEKTKLLGGTLVLSKEGKVPPSPMLPSPSRPTPSSHAAKPRPVPRPPRLARWCTSSKRRPVSTRARLRICWRQSPASTPRWRRCRQPCATESRTLDPLDCPGPRSE